MGHHSGLPLVNRRRFLLTTVGLLGAPYVASAAPILSAGPRLRLVDAHTGATFDGAYRDAKGPIAHVMDELDLFLRDRRTDAYAPLLERWLD